VCALLKLRVEPQGFLRARVSGRSVGEGGELLLWRLVERTLRVHVETTEQSLTGWDKQATQKPTAFMMMTKFSAVMVIKVGGQRQLAHPLSTVQPQYLLALRVPATYFTAPPSG
jgi:hypothetical protein